MDIDRKINNTALNKYRSTKSDLSLAHKRNKT